MPTWKGSGAWWVDLSGGSGTHLEKGRCCMEMCPPIPVPVYPSTYQA